MTESVPNGRGLYYGWVVVIACNLIACITWGVGIFNQGVFVAWYVLEFGWSALELSVGPVIFHLWAGVAGVAVGRIIDRFGPRPVLLVGAVFMAASMVLFASVAEQWQVYPAFILAGTGFACIHTVTIGKIVARWFVAQRSRAMGAATFGAGVGGALLVPLNVAVIETHGLFAGGVMLAAVSMLVIVPVALWVIKDGPETLGLQPDGALQVRQDDRDAQDPMAGQAADARAWTLVNALRTGAFWAFAVCFALGMVAQSAYLFHQMSFLRTTLGMMGAASVVSITTLCGIAGRVMFVLIGDRFAARRWVVVVFALQAASFVTLALAESEQALTLGSALFGLTMGVAVTLQPLSIAQTFGRTSFGSVYGPVYMAIRFGSAAGPLFVGVLLEVSGNYHNAWLLQALCLAVATLALRWAVLPAERMGPR